MRLCAPGGVSSHDDDDDGDLVAIYGIPCAMRRETRFPSTWLTTRIYFELSSEIKNNCNKTRIVGLRSDKITCSKTADRGIFFSGGIRDSRDAPRHQNLSRDRRRDRPLSSAHLCDVMGMIAVDGLLFYCTGYFSDRYTVFFDMLPKMAFDILWWAVLCYRYPV